MNLAPEWLVELHQHSPHLLRALLTGTLVSTTCGMIGCFIILRRTAFLADALAHSMLAGVVCGYLLMKLAFGVDASAPAMLVGSLLAGVFTVIAVGFVSRFSRIKEDTVIGIIYTGVFAVGGVLLSLFSEYVHLDLAHVLTGNLVAVENTDLWMVAVVAAIVVVVVFIFFRQLQLISFDPVMAASIGVPVLAVDYLLTTCTSLVVVAGVNVVGIILVVGLLIIPAATAYLLCDRLNRMVMLAAAFGWSGFLLGYAASEWINVASGSAIVVACVLQFLVVLAVAPRYGLLADWIRRRSTVPQPLQEDVLGLIYRAPQHQMRLQELSSGLGENLGRLRSVVRSLARREWLTQDNDQLTLTGDGCREARKLVRAHRLWETYLYQFGVAEDALHEEAHKLEHVHDEEAVDYLDDKLGHPLRDPHGSPIPEDFVHLVPGAEVKAALLREGHRATVVKIGQAATGLGMESGMVVSVGPRRKSDNTWLLRLPNGVELRVSHGVADAVTVRLLELGATPDAVDGAGGHRDEL